MSGGLSPFSERLWGMQENTIHNEKNKQSIWTNPELTQVLELADKNIKRIIITVVLMFKKLNRDIEDTKHTNLISRDGNYNMFNGKYTGCH